MPATSTDRLSGLTTSVAVKPPCVAVADSNITLSGLQTIGGVALSEGDRVLVRAQASAVDNGIYIASTSDWQRSADFDGARDVVNGTLVVNTNDTDIYYRVTTADPITIGSSPLTFEVIGAAVTATALGLLLYPRTAAEIAAGVTPTNYAWPEGHLSRYGATGNGTTDNSTAIQNAINVCQKNGQSIQGIPGVYRHTQQLLITSSLTISPPTIVGPRVFAPAGGGNTAYGGIEFLFDPPANPSNAFATTSYAISINTGAVGTEGFARVRINGLGVSWTQPKAGGIYIQGAVDVGIQDCWLTGGLTNYMSAAGVGIYCQDAIVSHFQRNTVRYAGYGIVGENYFNENEISRNDFDHIVTAGVVLRGTAGSSVRWTVRSNNFFGDGTTSMTWGVYVSGVVNSGTIDENTFELTTHGAIAISNFDLINATTGSTPNDIHISGNCAIASNSVGGAAIQLVACNGASVWGNQLLSPPGPLVSLVNVSASNTSNISIWANDTGGKPLISGSLAPCVILDDVLYRTMPGDSVETSKSSWGAANEGAIWWNGAVTAMRMWMGANIASIQPCAVLQLSSNAATPSITGYSVLELQYTSNTNITNLTGAFLGQEVTVIYHSGAGVPTIVNGTFVLQGGVNFVMASHNTLTAVWDGSNWWEKCRKT